MKRIILRSQLKSFSNGKRNELLTKPFSLLLIFLTSTFVSIAIFLQGEKGEIRRFFLAQANSILRGSLEVNKTGDLPGECYLYQDKCFGYFGITPSILRIPQILFGSQSDYTPFYVSLAIICGLIASVLVLSQILKIFSIDIQQKQQAGRGVYVLLLIMVLPGNLMLQLVRPSGLWEAIAWGTTFTLFGVYYVLKWYLVPTIDKLLIILMFFLLAANSRITNGLIAFGVATVCLIHVRRRKIPKKVSQIFLLIAIGLAPIASGLCVFYLKFDTIFPPLTLHQQIPEMPMWQQVLEVNGGKTHGLVFLLTNFVTYFRPNSVELVHLFDLVSIQHLKPTIALFPLANGGMVNEPAVSITNLMPISVVMLISICFLIAKLHLDQDALREFGFQRWDHLLFLARLAFACCLSVVVTLTFVYSSNRYLGDFVPGVLMFAILGVVLMYVPRKKRSTKVTYWFLGTLILFGTVINIWTTFTRVKLGIL